MKAHRLKTGFTSKEDLRDRFNAELFHITDRIVSEKISGKGILARFDFLSSGEYKDLHKQERTKLAINWERRGINTAFLK